MMVFKFKLDACGYVCACVLGIDDNIHWCFISGDRIRKTLERMTRRFYKRIPKVYNSSHHKILILIRTPEYHNPVMTPPRRVRQSCKARRPSRIRTYFINSGLPANGGVYRLSYTCTCVHISLIQRTGCARQNFTPTAHFTLMSECRHHLMR